MSKKLTDLDQETQRQAWDQLSTSATLITGGEDGYASTTRFGPNHEHVVGLCASCEHYEYVENETHQIIYAACGYHNKSLGKHRIKTCSRHTAKGRMSLREMWSIATLIDPPKERIGF